MVTVTGWRIEVAEIPNGSIVVQPAVRPASSRKRLQPAPGLRPRKRRGPLSEGIVNVLIVYGTTEGQTRKIAAWTATHIRERGHQVELQDSAALASDLKLGPSTRSLLPRRSTRSTIRKPSRTSCSRITSC